jgi:hypothetical protein
MESVSIPIFKARKRKRKRERERERERKKEREREREREREITEKVCFAAHALKLSFFGATFRRRIPKMSKVEMSKSVTLNVEFI